MVDYLAVLTAGSRVAQTVDTKVDPTAARSVAWMAVD